MTGQKIIDGLTEALAGNFARVHIEGETWVRQSQLRPAINAKAYAVGVKLKRGRFKVRKVVWGRLLAREERREGETIKKVQILVEC